jgi:head-tail adaptor
MPPIASYRHRVTVQNPGPPVADGQGGYTEGWNDAVPPVLDVSITPATARDLERIAAGTVLTQATHLIRGRYHPQISTASHLLFGARVFAVIYVGNPEERNTEIVLVCAELLTPAAAGASSARLAPPRLGHE